MSCDVISAAVNLSSRVESLTKYYRCKILATEYTINNCSEEVFCREIDNVCVNGISTAVKIFEIFPSKVVPELQQLKEKYGAARKYYNERDFQRALQLFEQLKNTGDRPAERFYERYCCSATVVNVILGAKSFLMIHLIKTGTACGCSITNREN